MLHIDGKAAVIPAGATRLIRLMLRWPLTGLLLGGFAAPAMAEARSDFGCPAEIRVAVFEFGPWYENGKGITVDLLEAIRQRTGCRFALIEIPRAEAWIALANGDVDIIPTSIQTSERLKLARFVTYLNVRNLMIVRTDAAIPVASLDAFVADRTGRIGVINGFLYGSYFDFRLRSLFGDERISGVDDPRQLVDMLRQGEVDAILMPAGHYFSYVPEMERQAAFRVLDTSLATPQPSGYALSRRSFTPLQTDNWLRLIELMFLDGSLESLVSRHLPPRIAATITKR